MSVLSWLAIFALILFGVPVMVYLCVKAGTVGYLQALRQFYSTKNMENDDGES